MSTYRCFWLESTGRVKHSLLVIDLKSDCAGRPGKPCRAMKHAAEYATKVDENGIPEWVGSHMPDDNDPSWPGSCDVCNRTFCGEVMRSTCQELIYIDEVGNETTLREAQFGAMWNEPGRGVTGPDGICLMVKTPGGDWCVDGPSWENGVKKHEHAWKRTGKIPVVTATPSIHILSTGYDGAERSTIYHGWLREGVLIDA